MSKQLAEKIDRDLSAPDRVIERWKNKDSPPTKNSIDDIEWIDGKVVLEMNSSADDL